MAVMWAMQQGTVDLVHCMETMMLRSGVPEALRPVLALFYLAHEPRGCTRADAQHVPARLDDLRVVRDALASFTGADVEHAHYLLEEASAALVLCALDGPDSAKHMPLLVDVAVAIFERVAARGVAPKDGAILGLIRLFATGRSPSESDIRTAAATYFGSLRPAAVCAWKVTCETLPRYEFRERSAGLTYETPPALRPPDRLVPAFSEFLSLSSAARLEVIKVCRGNLPSGEAGESAAALRALSALQELTALVISCALVSASADADAHALSDAYLALAQAASVLHPASDEGSGCGQAVISLVHAVVTGDVSALAVSDDALSSAFLRAESAVSACLLEPIRMAAFDTPGISAPKPLASSPAAGLGSVRADGLHGQLALTSPPFAVAPVAPVPCRNVLGDRSKAVHVPPDRADVALSATGARPTPAPGGHCDVSVPHAASRAAVAASPSLPGGLPIASVVQPIGRDACGSIALEASDAGGFGRALRTCSSDGLPSGPDGDETGGSSCPPSPLHTPFDSDDGARGTPDERRAQPDDTSPPSGEYVRAIGPTGSFLAGFADGSDRTTRGPGARGAYDGDSGGTPPAERNSPGTGVGIRTAHVGSGAFQRPVHQGSPSANLAKVRRQVLGSGLGDAGAPLGLNADCAAPLHHLLGRQTSAFASDMGGPKRSADLAGAYDDGVEGDCTPKPPKRSSPAAYTGAPSPGWAPTTPLRIFPENYHFELGVLQRRKPRSDRKRREDWTEEEVWLCAPCSRINSTVRLLAASLAPHSS